jgi:DNA ligase-1
VDWRDLRYLIFDLPGASGSFAARAQRMAALARQTGWAQLQAVEQVQLNSPQALQRRLEEVVAGGGEGLILHRADASYETVRSTSVLKLKPLHDAEARVIGHIAGRGRHIGRLGALRVLNEQGVSFLLGTGLSDAQRQHPPAIGTLVSYSPATASPRTAYRVSPASCVCAQSTSEAKSARRERSPRASVTWPPCGQPLKRSTA